MDAFSYHNIFETKGIEYLVVIGFLLLIVPFWILLNRPVKLRENISSITSQLIDKLRIPQGLFLSKNHTWTYLKRSGNARIGLDDLLLHITGKVELKNLLNPGDKVLKGDLIANIVRDGKQLDIVSPLTGEIKSVNSALVEKPGSLAQDPYGEGWFCEIRPDKWMEETKACYLGDAAVEWTRREMERLKDFFAQSLQKYSPATEMIMQEGGELADHPLAEMPAEIWRDFQVSFLNRLEICVT